MKKLILITTFLLSFASHAQADSLSIAKEALSDEIMSRSPEAAEAKKLEFSFTTGKQELQVSTSEDISVTSFELDQTTKRFDAFLLIDGKLPVQVAGKYAEFIEIPALTRKMLPNEVITSADIAYIEIEASKTDRGFVIDEANLIGKSPTRTLIANRPILANLIKQPNLVQEKQTVTIYFKNKFIQMQDLGVALNNGAKGDIVKVKNSTSNIIVSGRVVGENLVEVMPQNAILASSN